MSNNVKIIKKIIKRCWHCKLSLIYYMEKEFLKKVV